ncbi:hypothetical protein EC957_005588 [Mortierella hygrophila]|uniref:Uncharacterized protein n=1 Tax=Mortierella hygrophila TaxID=979708 RepID=A0A9P6JZL3_9FUNG|nr:hypothetical protein EC957_005588 [Mortierella hygrophila]
MTPPPAINFIPRGPSSYQVDEDTGNTGNAASFFGHRSVRDTWIAVSVLWILWAILFVARQAFGSTRVFAAPRGERVASSNAPVSAEQGPYDAQDGLTPMPGGGAVNGTATTGVAGQRGGAVNGTATTGHAGHHGFFSRSVNNVRDRVDRTYELIRDLTLMLLLVVTLNTFGLGAGVPVLVLAWIYVAIAFFWAGLMMLIESRVIDMMLGTLQMLLLLGIFIAAYVVGWSVFD